VSAPVAERSSSTALKEKLMRKLARNSKDYIKNLVLGLVHKYGKMGALQLREIVVEEQGLCSKSSFYRVLEEMEKESSLQVISDGKHTVYVAASQHATQ
jgi:predicted ATPase with chaperone activity